MEGRPPGTHVLKVFDPPLCCSSGVCGPEPDAELIGFAADVEWLRERGVEVRRFNPAHEPGAFTTDPLVRRALQERGSGCLPMVVLGDQVLSVGEYPTRDRLAAAAGLVASAEAGPVR